MQRETEAAAEADAPIAAFAVSKGGVVIKHVFLNAPPPDLTTGDGGEEEEEVEDPPVKVGRHPDCHVLVDHPSVSRFHLELRARRRQRRITVTDLSSGDRSIPLLCANGSCPYVGCEYAAEFCYGLTASVQVD